MTPTSERRPRHKTQHSGNCSVIFINGLGFTVGDEDRRVGVCVRGWVAKHGWPEIRPSALMEAYSAGVLHDTSTTALLHLLGPRVFKLTY